jgi:hypothetical protein
MVKARVVSVTLAGLALAAAAPASADPITITSGMVTVGGFARGAFRSTTFVLSGGDSFSISGANPDGGAQAGLPPCTQFAPCTTGATTNPSISYGVAGSFGSATLDGTAYSQVLYQGGRFTFSGEDVVLPPATADTFDLRSPFLFQGLASIWTIGSSNTPVFYGDYTLTGQGTATTHLERFGSGYAISGFTYEFSGEAASPTPEPGSILLLGTGVVAVWRSRRARGTR